ncbi:MAG: AsmA family protein [Lautropia sp.]|nr:AsmA family protein [Lautropia sp.]
MFRKLLIAVGVVLGLLVVLAIGVSFVDVNYFKPQITSYVSSRYQRTLAIDGDLSLSVFPNVGVTLPSVRLSEPNNPEEDAARLQSARVSIALLPLLKGEVQADTVSIDGLDARIVRKSDGTLSIDDLIGASDAGTDAAQTEEKPVEESAERAGGGKIPAFRINGVELKNSRVVYEDQQTGQRLNLERLNLETGPLANVIQTPVSLSLGFGASSPEARGDFNLKGRLNLDLDEGLYGFNDFNATLKGAVDTVQIQQLGLRLKSLSFNPNGPLVDVDSLLIEGQGRLAQDSFKASLAAPRLAIAKDNASGENVQAILKLGDKEWLYAGLNLHGVGGTAETLKIERLGFDTKLTQDGRKVVAQVGTPVEANLAGGSYRLTRLDGSVDIDDPAVPKAASKLTLGGAVALDLNKETVSADLNALIDKAKMVLKAGVNGFSKPKINVSLDADELNIDHLFPAAKEDTAALPPAAPGNQTETPVDLSAMKGLTLDARIGVGHLVARGLEMRSLKANAKIANGRLNLAPVSASLYDGRLAASSIVTTGSTPAANKMTLKADLTGISIEPLLKGVADLDMLEGKGNVNVAVNTGGGTVESMKRALAGNAAVALKDGALKGINLGEKIRQAKSMFQRAKTEQTASDSTQKTDFTEMSVSFQIQNGVARSKDLSMKSPLLRVGGEGSIDIGRSVLDYTVMTSVVGTSRGQGGKDLSDVRGVTIPVRLTGAFDAPSWQIDWATAAREALKSKAAGELKEQAEGKLKQQLEKSGVSDKLNQAVDKDKAKEALKGLLGR